MKSFFISFIFFFVLLNGYTQNPFNFTRGGNDNDGSTGISTLYKDTLIISNTINNTSGIIKGFELLKIDVKGTVKSSLVYNSNINWVSNFKPIQKDFIASTGRYFSNSSNLDVGLAILNLKTNAIFEYHYGSLKNEIGNDFIQLYDSGFIIVGNQVNNNNKIYIYIVHTNKNGDSIWTRTIGDSYGQEAKSIEKFNDSTYVVTGFWGNPLSNSLDLFTMKINLQGDTTDLQFIYDASDNAGNSLIKTSDGGYAIAGWSTYDFVVHEQMVMYKLDSNLNLLWTKYYGYLYTDEAFDIKQTYDKGYILVGYSQQTGRGEDVYVVRTDSMGDTLWTKTLGGIDDERAYSVVQTPDSGFAIVGYTYSFGAGGSDAFFLKLKPNGDITTSIGLPIEPENEEIHVYPNPAINTISIDFSQNTYISTIKIVDNLGMIVKELRIDRNIQSETLPIDNLSDGIYFIQLQSENGSIISKKFIKQNK